MKRILCFLICMSIITSTFLLILWREYHFAWLIVSYIISFLFYFGVDNEEIRREIMGKNDDRKN